MTINITKLIKIFEKREIEGLSIRKTAKKSKLNKNTVVKYLKLFPHGFNSYKVNIKSIKNKTFLSNIRPSLEKIHLPIDTVEDELEDNHLENTVISLNMQITKLNEDINNLIEEIENKTQVIQELNLTP